MERRAGILMPISALPSPYGIGTMGGWARRFIDFLEAGGQTYWQLLPIGPTGYGDSPYQSLSAFAGNPYFIDLDELKKEGWLKRSEYKKRNWGKNPACVDYGTLYTQRFAVLRIAAKRMLRKPPKAYALFLKKNAAWLEDYALFMAEKDAHGGLSFMQWEEPLRRRRQSVLAKERKRLQADIAFYQAVQFFFDQQWAAMRAYAHAHHVQLIGDMPIYVSPDSSDLWAHPELFQLDRKGKPKEVAGCPPDGFSTVGQLWGNPLYNWSYLKKTGYAWWVERIRAQLEKIDVLRIDHFRGFESYYAIPYGETTACNGRWRKGPGKELFTAVEKEIEHPRIIAEDLGFLTPQVRTMIQETGYPGMKILEFAFDSRDATSDYLPHMYPRNCVVYIGTHDNETIMGWMKSVPKDNRQKAVDYLYLNKIEGYNWGFMRGAYASIADLAIIQFQDLLGLDNRARMNTPSTIGRNWVWRAKQTDFSHSLARKLYHRMALYDRLPEKKAEE
mgnify:CR=1 FL=1